MRNAFYSLVLFLFLISTSHAAEVLSDREQNLYKQIRCVVCQSQSLHESSASMAEDMKVYIKTQIDAGKSDDDIKADLVARYGQSVLMTPSVRQWPFLWLMPLAILGVGAIVCRKVMTGRR